jgi:cytochrome c peroxidase
LKLLIIFFVFGFGVFCALSSFSTGKSHTLDNSMQVKLGALLFTDKSLSINGSQSCATCHNPQLYFTDGYRKAIGTYGDVLMHNTPSILNSFSNKFLSWRTPSINTLSLQMLQPLFAQQHIEMGMHANDTLMAAQILNKPQYTYLLQGQAKQWTTIIKALVAFEHTLVSTNSKYDMVVAGKQQFTQQERMGYNLFFSQQLACATCHGGQHFNTPSNDTIYYTNNGSTADTYLYKIPSLRNVQHTAPYMHNGSLPTLAALIQCYANGGLANNYKHKAIKGFNISNTQVKALIAFLHTLTDTTVIQKYNYLNEH